MSRYIITYAHDPGNGVAPHGFGADDDIQAVREFRRYVRAGYEHSSDLEHLEEPGAWELSRADGDDFPLATLPEEKN